MRGMHNDWQGSNLSQLSSCREHQTIKLCLCFIPQCYFPPLIKLQASNLTSLIYLFSMVTITTQPTTTPIMRNPMSEVYHQQLKSIMTVRGCTNYYLFLCLSVCLSVSVSHSLSISRSRSLSPNLSPYLSFSRSLSLSYHKYWAVSQRIHILLMEIHL